MGRRSFISGLLNTAFPLIHLRLNFPVKKSNSYRSGLPINQVSISTGISRIYDSFLYCRIQPKVINSGNAHHPPKENNGSGNINPEHECKSNKSSSCLQGKFAQVILIYSTDSRTRLNGLIKDKIGTHSHNSILNSEPL